MRKSIIGLVSAAALALPLAGLVPNAGAAALTPTCTTNTGKATFTPALPKLGNAKKVLSTIAVNGGVVKGCTGGGVTSAVLSGKIKFKTPGNCTTLVQGTGGATTGTITLKWNKGLPSTVAATLKQVSGNATQATITGPITAGSFKGKKVSSKINFTPQSGGCTSVDLAFVTYKNVGSLTVK